MTINKKDFLEKLYRVNLAGEYGAKRIYQGQLSVIKNQPDKEKIQHMLEQEMKHLEYFEDGLASQKTRPSLLTPLWHIGGFAMGAATALLGEKAAYACTVAVEQVIDKHYQEQLETIKELQNQNLEQGFAEDESLKLLAEDIEKFRQEEVEHKETSENLGAESAPFYPLIHFAVSNISKLAIKLAEKL